MLHSIVELMYTDLLGSSSRCLKRTLLKANASPVSDNKLLLLKVERLREKYLDHILC